MYNGIMRKRRRIFMQMVNAFEKSLALVKPYKSEDEKFDFLFSLKTKGIPQTLANAFDGGRIPSHDAYTLIRYGISDFDLDDGKHVEVNEERFVRMLHAFLGKCNGNSIEQFVLWSNHKKQIQGWNIMAKMLGDLPTIKENDDYGKDKYQKKYIVFFQGKEQKTNDINSALDINALVGFLMRP